jgi:hypothetical protein
VAVTAAMNRDLQFRFRIACIVGLGAALATWLLNGYFRFDGAGSLLTAAAGALAFGLVTIAAFVAPYLVPREWRLLETVFAVSRRSSRVRREAFGDGSVPATPRQARAWLARHGEDTDATRGARVWAMLVVGDLEAARVLARRMPEGSATDRFHRAAARAMVRLVEGGEPGLGELHGAAAELYGAERTEAEIDIGLLEALVAAADGGDWRAAILALHDRVDAATGQVLARWFLPVIALVVVATVVMTLVAYAFSSIAA